MFNKIKVEKFRCFESFELDQLGRVNLLVGTNNSGKTSALEAIQLLCSRTSLDPLVDIMVHRGEYIVDDMMNPWQISGLDIRHLFRGHRIDLDSHFSISGFGSSLNKLDVFLEKTNVPSGSGYSESSNELSFCVKIAIGSSQFEQSLSFTELSGISIKVIDHLSQVSHLEKKRQNQIEPIQSQFIRSSSLSSEKMMDLFDLVVLTPQEYKVQEALRIIDSNIDRIATVNTRRAKHNYHANIRDGFVVRLADSNQRVPIGSLGDGTWRMLGLALSIVCTEGGVLLVDEIDTGLHFTAMADMWKLIWETAKKLNVQVFATTHNSDCWTSLASIACQDNATKDGITIQRIERDKEKAVAFTEEEIVIAAERGIEVR